MSIIAGRMALTISRVQFAAFLLLIPLATGCIRSKTFWQNRMEGPGTLTVGGEYESSGLKPPLVLTAKQITNSITGTETNGRIRVSYESGLQTHAALVANLVEQSLRQTQQLLDSSPPLDLHIYLLRLPNERRTIRFNMSLSSTNHTMPWLMPLTNLPPATNAAAPLSNEALWMDLHDLPVQVFIIAHESWELHLVHPGQFLVMPDITRQYSSVKWANWSLKHRTRWFRDGFANYAGYKASEFLRQSTAGSAPPGTLRFALKRAQPFTELAKSRDKIFDWHQDSKDNYYDAATALFLLIEQRLGPEAIAGILRELPKIKFPNGNALLKLVRQKTGLDLREIARTFEFPDLGIRTKDELHDRLEIESVVPGTWAARANLREGDSLLEANSAPLTDLVQLELQMLKALEHKQPFSLTYSRDGRQHTSEALPLNYSK